MPASQRDHDATASARPEKADLTLLSALVEAAPTGLVALNDRGCVVCVNPAFLTWAGRSAGPDPIGQGFAEAFPGLVRQDPAEPHDGLRWVQGPGQGWIGHVQAMAEARHASALDALTGLGGRSELGLAFAALVESGAVVRGEVSFLALDLDRFKEVNDTFGHPVGDELLRRVARRVAHVVGSSGTVFRLGGDEFSVLLTCPEEGAPALARRLVNVLGRSFVIQGHEVQTGASIGLARVSPTASSVEAAYRDADTALYASKNEGRGQARLFEPRMARAMEERRLVERDLRRALLLDQIELHYQPQLDLQAGTVSGFEALARWRHPERGLIPPGAFIPVAEESRSIVEVGRWVLREACRTAAAWPSGQSVAVNVSSVQFADPRFLSTVFGDLEDSGLAPEQLDLEVTESVMMGDKALAVATMAELTRTGIRVSLDDFGTGYSSLSILSQLPFSRVKIDRAFVGAAADDHAVVSLIVDLCGRLGKQVVAEGIETQEQFESVRARGCHLGQGFLIGRPRPKGALAPLLRAGCDLGGQEPQDGLR